MLVTLKMVKRKVHRNGLIVRSSFLVQRVRKLINPSRGLHIDKVDKIMSARMLFGITIFIETGTYLGTTTSYVERFFSKVYTIELSDILAHEAQAHFKNKKDISVLKGDSGLLIEDIVKNNKEKKLFWLDAHYSAGLTATSTTFGDTPISREIEVILDNWVPHSVILVDDAGLFVGKDNYPTIKEVEDFVQSKNLNLSVFVDNRIIHIL